MRYSRYCTNWYAEHLFKDPKKLQILDIDPTITQMKSLKSYLRTLLQRNEILDEFD